MFSEHDCFFGFFYILSQQKEKKMFDFEVIALLLNLLSVSSRQYSYSHFNWAD